MGTTASAGPVLQADDIVKRFPGVTALSHVSFDLRQGEIHAICGENGAGKSTLIKVLSGIHVHGSYEGTLRVEGKAVAFATVKDAEQAGIGVIYQELALVDEMTVAENIFLGSEPVHGGLIEWDLIYRDAGKLLAQFGIPIDPATPVRDLGVGQRQLVEIVKALGKQTRILILDEPTAALTEQEVEILLSILRDLRARGIACIYISHKLDEVLAIADRITVLRDGATITTMDAATATKADLIRNMVGREITDLFPRRESKPGDVLLDVHDLRVADNAGAEVLHGISFEVRAGEVLGIGGLMGAGRSELLMHLFGAWGRRSGGTIALQGQTLERHTPEEAIQAGLILLSEDRKRYGLVLEHTIGFNLSLSSLRRMAAGGFIDDVLAWQKNDGLMHSLKIKAPGLDTEVGQLSGGNQQKVVIGKALLTEPKVVLLDEPTRGIDVGAKLEVYQWINEITAAGFAVVLVSSELPELMGMSDRVMMLHEGRVGGAFVRADATQERLLAAAMGQA